MRLTDLSFEGWLEHAFGHEVRFQANPWFFDPDSDGWAPEPGTALAYLTRLFEDPEPALRWFAVSLAPGALIRLPSSTTVLCHGGLQVDSVLARGRATAAKNDIDLAAERRQEAHQALDGGAAEPAVQDVGQVGLGDAQDRGCLHLAQLALGDDVLQPADKLGLQQMGLGVGPADVSEDVVAANLVFGDFARHVTFLLCRPSGPDGSSRRRSGGV
jgi:hypothetical protein